MIIPQLLYNEYTYHETELFCIINHVIQGLPSEANKQPVMQALLYWLIKSITRSSYQQNGTSLLLLALQFFVCFGLLNNSLSCFPFHSHLTPILNLRFSQILSDFTLSSSPLYTNPYCSWFSVCYSFYRHFFIHSYNVPNQSYSLCSYIPNYIIIFD